MAVVFGYVIRPCDWSSVNFPYARIWGACLRADYSSGKLVVYARKLVLTFLHSEIKLEVATVIGSPEQAGTVMQMDCEVSICWICWA
jgi:hypothetical protein